ncbi:MAG: hypothetical protein GC186_03410 [Rhodobacteraceae bacterium]|nr:hypothetical protein [Paracoccaceae bacterium]
MRKATFSRRELMARLAALSVLGIRLTDPRRAAAATTKGALARMKARYFRFATAPFPYDGERPDTGEQFLDVRGPGGRRGHNSPRGGTYYADSTYSDSRVLVALPGGFDLHKKAAIVVFFHGNQAILDRDVVQRQRVLDQLQASRLNAALVAPQFAVDALDSSAGRFWQPDAFARFMAEAAAALAEVWGAPAARASFARLPIILVAFSGGYYPAAYVLKLGGEGRRITGLVLLDALFGENDSFADWIENHHRSAFFFSAYTEAAAPENTALRQQLKAEGIASSTTRPRALEPGGITFLSSPGLEHRDYVTKAWVDDPLTWVFDRIPGLTR